MWSNQLRPQSHALVALVNVVNSWRAKEYEASVCAGSLLARNITSVVGTILQEANYPAKMDNTSDDIVGDWSIDLPAIDFAAIDLDDAEDFQLSKAQQKARFGVPLNDDDVDRAIASRIPEKTRRQTSWAFSVFRSWCHARGEDSGTSSSF